MAQKLSPAMKRTLHIMAEGHDVELWRGGLFFYPYYVGLKHGRVNSNTFEALKTRQLVVRILRPIDRRLHFILGYYTLTEAGRRSAEELEHD